MDWNSIIFYYIFYTFLYDVARDVLDNHNAIRWAVWESAAGGGGDAAAAVASQWKT